jgi:hypothetical protein
MKSSSWAYGLLVLSVASCACSRHNTVARAAPVDVLPVAPLPPPDARPLPDAAVDATVDATTPDAGAKPAAAPTEGQDFIDQARVLYRVAACGGDGPVPERFDAAKIDAHCKDLQAKYADYRRQWVDVATPYIANLRPKGLPDEVVYPFGGGDLMSALATFPDGSTYTTISLEIAADIRRVDTITPRRLDAELSLNRLHLGKLFEKIHSRTINLDIESKSDLPGEIVFSMVALAIYGFEPVSLRYFKFNADGTLRYLTAADIEAMEKAGAARKRSSAEVQADIFGDVELQFRKIGDAGGAVKTLRHVAYNLDDKHLRADPSLLRHLEAKGKVSAMTKAASHCLWSDDFSVIRQYLLDHMVWMISDTTGVPNKIATRAGFVQDTYGIMDWPAIFGFVDVKNAEDMARLWRTNPQHDLPFRYGYPDRDHHGHLMVTRPATSP